MIAPINRSRAAAQIAAVMTIAGGNIGPEPSRPSCIVSPFPLRGRFAAMKEVEPNC